MPDREKGTRPRASVRSPPPSGSVTRASWARGLSELSRSLAAVTTALATSMARGARGLRSPKSVAGSPQAPGGPGSPLPSP